jgi:hypothetical protein
MCRVRLVSTHGLAIRVVDTNFGQNMPIPPITRSLRQDNSLAFETASLIVLHLHPEVALVFPGSDYLPSRPGQLPSTF